MTEARKTLLIVEDDEGLRGQLRWCFPDLDVLFAGDRPQALEQLEAIAPEVMLLDLGLPPDEANASEGLAVLDAALSRAPDTKVIVMTGNEQKDVALRAVGAGAYDFYRKPVDPDVLSLIVERAFALHALQQENRRLQQAEVRPLDGVVGASREIRDVCRLVERLAPSEATVLLRGESGTGKEILARALHRLSPRGDEQFVAINCASIPDQLLESELFGHEKGAFTGAHRQSIGKIETANGGTLFLDEIGDLPSALQPKLLRFLQERVIERIGGRATIPMDVRVLSATHRDLSEMIRSGDFREDLYYRLAEVTVEIPPLRERSGDAALLARSMLRRFAEQERRRLSGFTHEALHLIESYPWPGNVRELENVVRRAVLLAEGPHICADDLNLHTSEERAPSTLDLRQAREEAERMVVERALGMAGGNMARTAELIGVSRPTLYGLLDKLGMRNLEY